MGQNETGFGQEWFERPIKKTSEGRHSLSCFLEKQWMQPRILTNACINVSESRVEKHIKKS